MFAFSYAAIAFAAPAYESCMRFSLKHSSSSSAFCPHIITDGGGNALKCLRPRPRV